MKTELQEFHELIGIRQPPGDNWQLTNNQGVTHGPVYKSLTDTLEAWFQQVGEEAHFRLEPLNGKLLAIRSEEVEIAPPEIKTFSLYGEFSQQQEQ